MDEQLSTEADSDPITVEVIRDGRLRTRLHWEWHGNQVRIRTPRGISQAELDRHMAEIVEKVKRRRAKVRARADKDLESLARRINRRYFDGEITWHSIRWVNNMRRRLGSCTLGGPTHGDIRISERIRGWPNWVVEYVVAHELTHLKVPNHSPEFWTLLNRYPRAERARGFIMGVAFQEGEDADGWL